MTARDDFDRTLTDWLLDARPVTPPDGLLDDVLRELAGTERRREWLIADRWTWGGRGARLARAARPALGLALVAGLIAALVVGVLIAGSRKPAPPFGLTTPGWITVDAAAGLIVARMDGTQRQVLVPRAGGEERNPTWSRDGLHLAYWHRDGTTGPWSLLVVDADGHDRQLVADGITLAAREQSFHQPSNLAWSPDSERLAYAADTPDGSAIFIVARSIFGPRRVTGPDRQAMDPAWSPDGTRIAYQEARAARLHVVGIDGSDDRTFDELGDTELWPDWSPDGQLIAVTRWDQATEDNDIWVVAPDGTNARNVSSDPSQELSPAWSPDGTRLAWGRIPADGSAPAYVVVASRDGSVVTQLRIPADLAPPAWSPDGTRLFSYVADANGTYYELVVLDPEGQAPPIRIPAPGEIGNGSWQRRAP